MMKMKHFLVIALLASMVAMGAVSSSEATCTAYGKIIYSYTNGTTLYVYVAVSQVGTLPTYYYFYQTTDPEMMQKLNTAQAGNLRCAVVGSVTSCPTTGVSRPAGIISAVYTYNY
jgi:hypothetical protein